MPTLLSHYPSDTKPLLVGFTGTQDGMTPMQKSAFQGLVTSLNIRTFSHGDCIGADIQAHEIVRSLPVHVSIDIYPPTNPSKRAFAGSFTHRFPPKPYLERNHTIVDASDCIIAVPKTADEKLRSGTWATVRYARTCKKWIFIIHPNGYVYEENFSS